MCKKFLVLIFLCLISTTLTASDYQVELIVFEHLYHNADGEITEIGLDIPRPSNTIALTDLANEDISGFASLSPGFYKLGGVYNELKYSSEYRPILHLSWQQPALNQSRARYVQVRKVDSVSGTDAYTDELVKVDGLVRIRSSQFLHADVDLFYFVNPVNDSFLQAASQITESISDGSLQFAHLKESRRMKLNELHYFDHPVFGLFLRVSRIKN